jgi:acyl-CoA thioester hydrolase
MSRRITLRVRYAETDQMGVAHHANYLVWFEAARTEFLRTSESSYADFERGGIFLPVREAACRYRTPAHYDDSLEVECSLEELTPARLSLAYRVTRGATLVAEGQTVHAFLGPERRPVNLKKRAPRLWAVLVALAAEGGVSKEEVPE